MAKVKNKLTAYPPPGPTAPAALSTAPPSLSSSRGASPTWPSAIAALLTLYLAPLNLSASLLQPKRKTQSSELLSRNENIFCDLFIGLRCVSLTLWLTREQGHAWAPMHSRHSTKTNKALHLVEFTLISELIQWKENEFRLCIVQHVCSFWSSSSQTAASQRSPREEGLVQADSSVNVQCSRVLVGWGAEQGGHSDGRTISIQTYLTVCCQASP